MTIPANDRRWKAASVPHAPFESFDITYAELSNLGGFYPTEGDRGGGLVAELVRRLGQEWMVGDPERARDVRIGTVYVKVDPDGTLHLDFIPRNPGVLWDRDHGRWKVQLVGGQLRFDADGYGPTP